MCQTWAHSRAGAPARQPADDFVIVDNEFEHDRERRAHLGEHVVEDLGLRDVAREAVEQEAVAGVVLVEPLLDHRDRHLVGYQVAGVHVPLGLVAQRGAVGHVRSEDVPGRDLGHRQVGSEELSLGALASAGRTHQDQSHYRRKPS